MDIEDEQSSYGTAEGSHPSANGLSSKNNSVEFRPEARTEADVVIVGAGVSGLSAAYQLMKRDPSLRVIVLEAKGC